MFFIQIIFNLFLFVFIFLIPATCFIFIFERKWGAMIQDRIGPNRAKVGKLPYLGVFHLFADIIKNFTKESYYQKAYNSLFYNAAPFFSFASVFLVFSLIPISNFHFSFQIVSTSVDLFLLFAFVCLSMLGSMLTSWSIKNHFVLIGGVRNTLQMFLYLVIMGFSLLPVLSSYQTASIHKIVQIQQFYWLGGTIPKWGIFTQPISFFLFFIACLAVMRRPPFDTTEKRGEILTGHLLENTGVRFNLISFTEYLAMLGSSMVIVTIFLGSYHLPWIQFFNHSISFSFFPSSSFQLPELLIHIVLFLSFVIKTLLVCWLQIMVRWTLPKLHIQQIINLGWKRLIPLSLINILATSLFLLLK
ncbi:MAG: NADH-quinone oxidoreductase subunit H [bacterium]|jgi:NADH-quinone oxidoreductase subunit H